MPSGIRVFEIAFNGSGGFPAPVDYRLDLTPPPPADDDFANAEVHNRNHDSVHGTNDRATEDGRPDHADVTSSSVSYRSAGPHTEK